VRAGASTFSSDFEPLRAMSASLIANQESNASEKLILRNQIKVLVCCEQKPLLEHSNRRPAMNQPDPSTAALAAFDKLHLYIGGHWREGSEGRGEDVFNPATGRVLGRLCPCLAPGPGPRSGCSQRGVPGVGGNARHRATAHLAGGGASAARTHARDCPHSHAGTSKTLAESTGEMSAAIDVFEWYAEETRRLYGRLVPARAAGITQAVGA
jgi:succinate-semialdehyde dehydrogenase/glutarate-semialdehyde dehydrogenase